MKNKSTMLLLGVGVAYILYRLYAKKSILPPGIVEAVQPPVALYPSAPGSGDGGASYVRPDRAPIQFVDNIRSESIDYDTPNTYQTYYGSSKILGTMSRVPSTC